MTTSARIRFGGVALAIAAIACSDYARTNPYDANVPVSISISGPDTLFSFAEQGHYAAQTSPIFADSAVEWASLDTFSLTPLGPATFRSSAPPLYPATTTVQIAALIGHLDTVKTICCIFSVPDITWRHKQVKNVVLTQRVTHIQLRCPVTACDTLSVGGATTVWADGFDALSHEIVALTSAIANPLVGDTVAIYAMRDKTIASAVPFGTRTANITALKSGTTWIIGTRGALMDSLRVVVR